MTKLLPLPKAEPWQEPYFLILYLWYYSVGHYELVPLGEYKFDSKLTALLSQSALTLQQLTGAVYTLITNSEKSRCQSPATFYPHLWTRPHLFELLNLGQKLNLKSEQALYPSLAETMLSYSEKLILIPANLNQSRVSWKVFSQWSQQNYNFCKT